MSKINDFQKQTEIPQAMKRYLEATGGKKVDIARAAGIDGAFVSNISNGHTIIGKTEIKDKYYEAICKVINYNIRPIYWRHFNTEFFAKTILAIKEARANHTRVSIDGDTGSGKTHACREYLKRYPSETYIVTCSAIENSKEFAINIGEAVGVETIGTAGKIIKRVVAKLLKCDNPVLIIDEAEHIGNKTGYINIIKTLADALNDKVGFVLLGMGINDIFDRTSIRRKQNFRQTARRFGNREFLREDDFKDDIPKICEEVGIRNKSAQNFLQIRIQNFGDLESIVTYALKTSESIGKEVSVGMLKSWFE